MLLDGATNVLVKHLLKKSLHGDPYEMYEDQIPTDLVNISG